MAFEVFTRLLLVRPSTPSSWSRTLQPGAGRVASPRGLVVVVQAIMRSAPSAAWAHLGQPLGRLTVPPPRLSLSPHPPHRAVLWRHYRGRGRRERSTIIPAPGQLVDWLGLARLSTTTPFHTGGGICVLAATGRKRLDPGKCGGPPSGCHGAADLCGAAKPRRALFFAGCSSLTANSKSAPVYLVRSPAIYIPVGNLWVGSISRPAAGFWRRGILAMASLPARLVLSRFSAQAHHRRAGRVLSVAWVLKSAAPAASHGPGGPPALPARRRRRCPRVSPGRKAEDARWPRLGAAR